MAADPLEQVLQMVADGRLTADEAAPILAALDDRSRPGPATAAGSPEPAPATGGGSGAAGDRSAGGGRPAAGAGGGGALRIEVRENGRQVVNLRLPVAVGRLALERVPGLSGDQVDRVRDALRTGMHGPILEVNDDTGNVVRIVVE